MRSQELNTGILLYACSLYQHALFKTTDFFLLDYVNSVRLTKRNVIFSNVSKARYFNSGLTQNLV